MQLQEMPMIRYYKLEQGRVVETPDDTGAPILLCIEPDEAERSRLAAQYHIDEHNLSSALDPAELPRVEIDSDHLAVIIKHPKRYSAKDNLLFRVNSLGLFLYRDRLIVVAPQDADAFQGRSFNKLQNIQMLFLRMISTCVAHFFSHLQVINDIASELEPKLVRSMANRHLLQMFSIEKSLVYYVNAISANGRVIERLKTNARNEQIFGLSLDMTDYADDLAIDNAQCLEQAQVYANVFTGLMDARASIVSNNLNVLMKRLTVINVVFMPLNILAGIGGMSEFSMMTRGIPWPFAYLSFMMGLTAIGLITYKILGILERRQFTG
jgi:magnesium transporter